MGGLSIWHWLIVLVVVMLLFGTGKVSNLMGEFGKGIKTFKQNVASEDDEKKTKDASMSEPSSLSAGYRRARAAEDDHQPGLTMVPSELAAALVEIGQRMDGRGWVPGSAGNLSARIDIPASPSPAAACTRAG